MSSVGIDEIDLERKSALWRQQVTPPFDSARVRGALGVWRPLTVYAVVALVFSWPLVVSLRTHLGAPEGPGDPYLNVWILGWDLRTITTHPAWLLTGRIFDLLAFFPQIRKDFRYINL